MENPKKYRPEIDGLRAIAVMIVFLGHLNVSFFHGGFVGVDVFFVISGFLITGIIHREIEQGKFNLIHFYERRIRRIIPAFYVFSFLVSLYVLLNSLPEETMAYFKSLLATVFYGSNYFFLFTTNYFDAAANTKPLLHTWSLGLEEQFYFVFPLLMIFISRKLKKYLKIIFVLLLLISVISYLYYLAENPTVAFYSLLTRFWELLIGGLLALGIFKNLNNKWVSELVGLFSMILIFYPVITISQGVLNPGPYAFLPVAGAVLFIYSNNSHLNIIGRALSLGPMVFVGKISYSLYLWHWAFIVFFLENNKMVLNPSNKIFVLIISFLFASLSWKFIEQPLRLKKIFRDRKSLFLGFAASSLSMILLASMILITDGWPSRFGTDFLQLRKVSRNKNNLENKCFSKNEKELKDQIERLGSSGPCSLEKRPSYFLWGDSHGAAAISMVEAIAKKNGRGLVVETSSGCPPLLDLSKKDGDPDRLCSQFNNLVIDHIKKSKPERVFLVARWSTYYSGKKHEQGPLEFLMKNSEKAAASSDENKEMFKKSILNTFQKLKNEGLSITLVLQPPEYLEHIPKKILSRVKNKDFNDDIGENDEWMVGKRSSENQSYFFEVNNFLKGLGPKLNTVNLSDFLCDKDYCIILKEGKSLYRDGNHISDFAAKWIGEKL